MKKKVFFWMLLLSWMLVIFLFSSQTGESSGSLSSGLLRRFILVFLPETAAQNSKLVHTLGFLLRKGAHMTEYAILAILAFALLRQYFPTAPFGNTSHKSSGITESCPKTPLFGRAFFQLLLILCFVFFYACTDEFHQCFVSERSGQFPDVLIDSLGGLLGCLLFLSVPAIGTKLVRVDAHRL